MAAPEEQSQGPRQYEEPHWSAVRPARNKEIPARWKLHSIIDGVIHIEPVQKDIKRYPPVQVDVPRRADFIDRYINMAPIVWSEIFKDDTPMKAGPVKLPDELL